MPYQPPTRSRILIDLSLVTSLVLLGVCRGLQWETGVVSLLVVVSFLIGITDFRFRIIPDALVVVIALVGLLQCTSEPGLSPIDSLAGALFGGGFLYALAVTSGRIADRDALGGGDIKLAAALGLFVGPLGMFVALFVAAVLALAYWAVRAIGRGDTQDHSVPFGPFLMAGALISRLELVHVFPSIVS